MQKTIAIIACGAAMLCSANAAETDWTLAEWNTQVNDNGTTTYTQTFNNGFSINLGDAAIKDNESFTLAINVKAPSYANQWGTGLISATADPYAEHKTADDFRVYVGIGSNSKVLVDWNNWSYTMNNVAGNAAGEYDTTVILSWDASSRTITMASGEGSTVTFDTRTDGNIVSTFNFATLTNESTQASIPDGTVTTISITKATPAPATPEPTTATLSLLALAGLAARRRRK